MAFDITQHFRKINVLDKGYIELIDGTVTDPLLKIVNAARISFLKESYELSEKDERLIKFLIEHEHFSTLRHSYFTFRIKAPLCVLRQMWRYQVGSDWIENDDFTGIGTIEIPSEFNETSGRYVEFEPEFYIPATIRKQSKNNKQGSEGLLEKIYDPLLEDYRDPVEYFKDCCFEQYEAYKALVLSGGAKEQARMLLPQNIYSECIWTCSLQTIIWFLHQRLKNDAQAEIRAYAQAILELMRPLFRNVIQPK